MAARTRRRRRDGHRHHRPRMGRHPRAEHAAAALVAVAVLSHHRLVDRLLDRLSVLAADVGVHRRPVQLAFARSHHRRHGRAQGAARPDGGTALAGVACRRSRPTSICLIRPRAGTAGLRRKLRAVPRRGGGGAKGYPNLIDDDWLWGGALEDIALTIRDGIRTAAEQGAAGQHAGLRARRHAQARRISRRSRTMCARSPGLRSEPRRDLDQGKKVFAETCAACHGADGKGNRELGAPNLTDAIWLYGSDRAVDHRGLWNGRGGMMPAWAGRLDESTIKALTIYVHTLGGGVR